MIERILILDTETTGTTPQDQIIEVAAQLYSIKHACAVAGVAALVQADGNPAESVNRIPVALLAKGGCAVALEIALGTLRSYAEDADAIMSYGAEFDRRYTGELYPMLSADPLPWICAMDDIDWPCPSASKSLVTVALAHNVGVVSAHRAMADVDTLSRLLTRVSEMGHNLGELLRRAMRPKARYIVAARTFDPERNQLAKEAGFRWDPDTKTWGRTIAIEDAVAVMDALPFAIERAP